MNTTHKYRHEIKYRINIGTYHILRQRFKAVMEADKHAEKGRYRITSLYFDDIYGTAFFDKENGILNRKKYRIRTYNFDKSFIRLEEKIKDNDVGYKKSAILTYDEYKRLISGDFAFLSEERFSDTSGEDFFVSASAAGLKPSVIVDYIREPYICEAGNVRLTFDMKISSGNKNKDMFDEKLILSPVFSDGTVILEVKYDDFIPLYIEQLLTGLPIMQESVSKYIYCRRRQEILSFGI